MQDGRTGQRALLERLREGNEEALSGLLESCRPYVRAVVQGVLKGRKTGPSQDDSDVVQEALMQASQSVRTFQGQSLEEWLGWLRQITVRTSYRFLNAKKVPAVEDGKLILETQADRTAVPPSKLVMRQEMAARMAEAMGRLPEDMQRVLLARVMDDLDHADIAQQLGRTPGAVRMLYLRALRQLRDVWTTEFSSGTGGE